MSFNFAGWTAKKTLAEIKDAGFYYIDLTSDNFEFPAGYTGSNLAVIDFRGFYKRLETMSYDPDAKQGWMILYFDAFEIPPKYLFYNGGLAVNPRRLDSNWTLRSGERDLYHSYAPMINTNKIIDPVDNITADATNQQIIFSFFNQPAWMSPPTRITANMSLPECIEFDLWIKLLEAPSETTPIAVKETNSTIQLGLYLTPERKALVKANWGDSEYETESDMKFPLNEWHLLVARLSLYGNYLQVFPGFQDYYWGQAHYIGGENGYPGEGELALGLESGLAEIAYFRIWEGTSSIDSLFDRYKGFLWRNGEVYHIKLAGAFRGKASILE